MVSQDTPNFKVLRHVGLYIVWAVGTSNSTDNFDRWIEPRKLVTRLNNVSEYYAHVNYHYQTYRSKVDIHVKDVRSQSEDSPSLQVITYVHRSLDVPSRNILYGKCVFSTHNTVSPYRAHTSWHYAKYRLFLLGFLTKNSIKPGTGLGPHIFDYNLTGNLLGIYFY